ncbi:ABC transporter ATP-binding protein [Pseudomonas corrugata]|uniref:ABC transporter ATP-binding protein n=1 Tax=Pseudomonas corrugata TaxID=47879 RepID=A0A7Y5Z8D8_9PSED|nr:ABC transporter ATP-binding protein [Pseudomonas corrugata]NUT88937.1 ABC transporter ATP-binding protein [Pseudomonas corrugata]
MSSDVVIRVEQLSKRYHVYEKPVHRLLQMFSGARKQYFKAFPVLHDVSFEIRKGETVGIIGRNGSGKSTLLQMICGTLNPSSGQVTTRGRIAALLELGSGFNPEFTGRENIYLNGAMLGLSPAEIDQRYAAIEAFAEIGEYIEQPVKSYSSGMYVRLAFAIQANIDPEILIVDEALAVGDAYFVHRCMDRLHQLQNQGTTIVLVTHDSMLVKRFCDRALWLHQGTVHSIGSANSVVDDYLAWLFQMPIASHTASIEPTPAPQMDTAEEHIANIDRRLGDQRCQIVGARLYDKDRNPTDEVQGGSEVILRFTAVNVCLPLEYPLTFGYIVRNFRGEEIAATNTRLEGMPAERFTAFGERITIEARIHIPLLYPGHYSISVGISYEQHGRLQLDVADRIINAIVFNVSCHKNISTMTCFDTAFSIQRVPQCA